MVPFAAGLVALFLILIFQNCGKDPHITANLAANLYSQKLAGGDYCTSLSVDNTKSWKFLMIIDMSRSNLGAFTGARFDFSKGTDVNGMRFDQMKAFIEGCGSTSNKNKFQVLLFSNASGVPGGAVVPTSLSCGSKFVDKTTALATVETARQIQERDKAFWTNYTNKDWDTAGQNYFDSGALFMMDTHYGAALNCAEQTIISDINAAPDEPSNYVMFFVTDGRPYDTGDACERASDKYGCYGEESFTLVASTKIDAAVHDRGLQVFPIYYGTVDPSDKANALKVLDRMAAGADMKSGAKSVSDFGADGISGLSKALCSLSQVARKIDYRKKLISVVNLTTKTIGNQILADSDMDGVPDVDEIRLGYDPANRRTFGVLDGICEIIGGPKACQEKMKQLACQKKYNNLSLSDCDLGALGVNPSATQLPRQFGLDTDRDGIPDLIEILRGTNPTMADAESDLDSDGVTNQAEINRGTDVERRPQNELPIEKMIQYTDVQVTTQNTCANGSESYHFELSNLPVVPVKAYSATEVTTEPPLRLEERFLDISHAENENVILLTYELEPANSSLAAPQLWGAVLKVKAKMISSGVYQPEVVQLHPEDFFYLGELK